MPHPYHRRRALELIASCRDGCTEAMMLARDDRARGRRRASRHTGLRITE
jgi:hypothetical protein